MIFHSSGTLNPPPARVDPFKLFGIPVQFDLDLAKLQNQFIELSRKVHPDRFILNPDQLTLATRWFALLSTAFNSLKGPVTRAELIFEANALPTLQASKNLPAELAGEYFELQELLEDTNSQGKALQGLKTFKEKLDECLEKLDDTWQAHLRTWDLDKTTGSLEAAQKTLSQRNYFVSMKKDLDQIWQKLSAST